jgi:hypothetical protein
MMLIGALLGDHRLDQDPEPVPITTALSRHQIKEQICARHRAPLSTRREPPRVVLILSSVPLRYRTRQHSAPSRSSRKSHD